MNKPVISAKGLTKKYGRTAALDSVDITVYRGDICAVIGRNGAGKTTLFRVLTGLNSADSGEYTVLDRSAGEISSIMHRVGSLIERPAFFPNLTAGQNLKYYALQRGITDDANIDEALRTVGMYDERKKKFRKLSLGMKQRLGIALAFLDDPDIVFLDEPNNGIDPTGISELRESILCMNREKGITFIISSHILTELYTIANRFMFIDGGRIIRSMTKAELNKECMRYTAVETNDASRAVALLEEQLSLTDYTVTDTSQLRIYQSAASSAEINRILVQGGVEVSALYESGLSIEDFFISIIGGDKQ